ncbi:hypothetical protein [Streptomyces sp. MAR4 CNX-425]|uniref:hypothetical protein n=1 Tax=Streptomyces sp. MAR4 CNX-425 TaxID=3406343 RepID=UPI003B501177
MRPILISTPINDELRLVAYAFRGDRESAERVWVCLRDADIPPGTGWLGSWSSRPETSNADETRRLIRELTTATSRTAGRGASGVWLGEHYFFAGWDTWGPGLPAPLLTSAPPAVVDQAVEHAVDGIFRTGRESMTDC